MEKSVEDKKKKKMLHCLSLVLLVIYQRGIQSTFPVFPVVGHCDSVCSCSLKNYGSDTMQIVTSKLSRENYLNKNENIFSFF